MKLLQQKDPLAQAQVWYMEVVGPYINSSVLQAVSDWQPHEMSERMFLCGAVETPAGTDIADRDILHHRLLSYNPVDLILMQESTVQLGSMVASSFPQMLL